MRHVFGPLPSRRLGQSLGIDPIPLKTCNWNCVYCQLGRTSPLVNNRCEYISRTEILAEVRQALSEIPLGNIDWVTFVGSGEPTLHSGLGWLIREVKSLTELPVAVITNGSLCYLPEVRWALSAADAVLPSLDAGSARVYRKINRPRPELSLSSLVNGLADLRQEYSGKLWIEVMLVRGLNDLEAALGEIAAVLDVIQPDQVHLNLPLRPPAEDWVQPPDSEGMARSARILGSGAQIVQGGKAIINLPVGGDLVDALVAAIARHPLGEQDIEYTLNQRTPGKAQETMKMLLDSGMVQVVKRYGCRFWCVASANYTQGSLKARK